MLVTDEGLSTAWRERLTAAGVNLVLASAADAVKATTDENCETKE